MAWLGDSYYIVTTGYNKQSNREVLLRDIRNIDNVVYTITADNDTVTAGQKLGTVGTISCECAEEAHIHLEVLQNGQYLDPANLLS